MPQHPKDALATKTLLGGLSVERFLDVHWQKRPLLVRQAIPGFAGFVTAEQLARLAGAKHAVARAVTHHPQRKQRRWQLDVGPLRLDLARAPKERWTFLVQGVEQHLDAGWELLQRFSFLPHARVDDLMISYAVPGGSVGPHVDEYDVFLLQGPGRRRWQIAVTDDLDVVDGEDVRVLRRFTPTDDWVLEPGDMLYLPPRVAHWGTAVDACMTYSIGFLAPSYEQLQHNFLAFVEQELLAHPSTLLYADPDLRAQPHPAELSDHAVAKAMRALAPIALDDDRVAHFFGRLLTGPKPSVRFTPPRGRDERALRSALERGRGRLVLARGSRMLFRRDEVFLNGEATSMAGAAPALRAWLIELADERAAPLPVPALDAARTTALVSWWHSGFVVVV